MKRLAVAVLLVLAACDGAATVTSTTTTVPDATTTTESQRIVDGGLIPQDPQTLIPLEGADPVVVGVSHNGVVSPSRQWAAIVSDIGAPATGLVVSIVDLSSLEVVSSADVDQGHVVINDNGRAFFFRESQLMTLGPDGALAAVDAPNAPPFLQASLDDLGDGRIGYLTASESERSQVRVVVVDGAAVLDVEVQATAGQTSDDPPFPHRELIVPAIAWTTQAAYVVSAEENQVEVVDLATGDSNEHDFEGADETFSDYVARSVWATGERLFVATSSLDVTEEDDAWRATESPGLLVVINVADWSSSIADIDVSELTPSPDGSVIAAVGTLVEWSSTSDASVSQTPVYLVDVETGEPLVGFQGNSGTIESVQFSPVGAEMYVVSQSDLGTNIDVVDVVTKTLVGNVAFTRISLIGEAGLMAFHATLE